MRCYLNKGPTGRGERFKGVGGREHFAAVFKNSGAAAGAVTTGAADIDLVVAIGKA